MPNVPAGTGYMSSVSCSPQGAQLQADFPPVKQGRGRASWRQLRGLGERGEAPAQAEHRGFSKFPPSLGRKSRSGEAELDKVEQVAGSNEEIQAHTHTHPDTHAC